MKEFRTLLLFFFSIVAARLLSELSSCQVGFETVCDVGSMVIVPFVLSVYFVDNALVEFYSDRNKKRMLVNTIFCVPYFITVIFFTYYFFSTITVTTIERIISLDLLLMFVLFVLIHWLNTLEKVRRLNTVFMVTFLLSLLIFYYV